MGETENNISVIDNLVLVSSCVLACYSKKTRPMLEKPGFQNTAVCENQGMQRKSSYH